MRLVAAAKSEHFCKLHEHETFFHMSLDDYIRSVLHNSLTANIMRN